MKIARQSFGPDWECLNEWPDNCKVQCGEKGIVFSKNNSYTTAFFEAFPRDPNTFIRGEGNSIKEAEEAAWRQYQRHLNCENHEFEKRGYKNGAGFCKHCDLFKSQAFDPEEKCVVCNTPTFYTSDLEDNWYCEKHADEMSEDLMPELVKLTRRLIKDVNEESND